MNAPVVPPATGKDALTTGGDFIKYLTALGTGALVFSVGLIDKDAALVGSAKWFIIGSWVCLAISVVGGILAYSRVPIMLAEGNYDLEDRYLTVPGRGQQVLFVFGVVALGIALVVILATRKSIPTAPPRQDANATSMLSARFSVVYSAPHKEPSGRPRIHTFLLDETTGELWQMVCVDASAVQFRKVRVEALPQLGSPPAR